MGSVLGLFPPHEAGGYIYGIEQHNFLATERSNEEGDMSRRWAYSPAGDTRLHFPFACLRILTPSDQLHDLDDEN